MDPNRYRSVPNSDRQNSYNSAGLPAAPPPKYHSHNKRSGSKRWVKVGLVIVAIVLIGGVGILVANGHKSKPTAAKEASPTRKLPAAVAVPKAPLIPSTSYTSTNFNTSFNYPNGWNLIDSGNAPLTVTSPVMNIIAANGQTKLGEIVLTLAQKGSVPLAFGSTSVAVLTSVKITFSQPSTSQAAQSYISFIQYPATTTRGGLDGIYLSGNYGYQKYQNIPQSNIAAVDPLVYVSFYSCVNKLCPDSSRAPLTIASTDWNNSQFSAPILLMFKSFTFD